jgi:hypothetical protein
VLLSMLILRAPREAGDHWVGLEPEAFYQLLKFAGAIGWGGAALQRAAHEHDTDSKPEEPGRQNA